MILGCIMWEGSSTKLANKFSAISRNLLTGAYDDCQDGGGGAFLPVARASDEDLPCAVSNRQPI